MTARRDAERKPRQQQEETRCQAALENPHVEHAAGTVVGREKRADRVPLDHQEDGDRPGEVDEDDPVRGHTGRSGRNARVVESRSGH
jgi:hypothetical protein